MEYERRYVRVNGIQMHYVTAGSGPLLLLLHGFPQFWYSWHKQIEALRDSFTLVAPDLRGYNETDKPLWGYETDVLTADVVGLIDALRAERVLLAGHDWGGNLAWNVAIRYPQRVERLAVLNAPHPACFAAALRSNPQQILRSWYMAFFQLPWLPELAISANNYDGIEQMLRRSARSADTFSDEDIARYKEAMSKPGVLTAAINWYRGGTAGMRRLVLAGQPAWDRLRVAVPTLLIWGEEDIALGKELTNNTGRYVPDLEVRYLPGCSHWVHEERPAEVNSYLREFFGATR